MRVLVIHSSAELFDELSEAERATLMWRWRQAVAHALDLPLHNIGAEWEVWAQSQGMENIEIAIPFSPGLADGAVDEIHRHLGNAIVTNSADILRGKKFEVGVWPQPHHGALYSDFWVEPNEQVTPLQGDPCPSCHVIGARTLATVERLSDSQGTCRNCGYDYKP